MDQNGNIYVAGPRCNLSGCVGNFISKLSADLTTLLASISLEGGGEDTITSLAIDQSGNVYVAGYTTSGNFPTTRLL